MPIRPEEEEGFFEAQAGLESYATDQEERNWAVVAQLSAFVGYLVPFGNIGAPLIVWLIKRDESEFIESHSRESLNFQISMTLYLVIAGILVWLLVGFILLPLLVLLNVIVVVLAALKASRGEFYRYPFCIRLVS